MFQTKKQMAFKTGVLIIFMACFSSVFAQNEANVWLLNNGQQLNFDSGEPELIDFEGQTKFASTICDGNGNLLLYSDGRKIWNKNHEVIVNGDDLIDDDSWIQNSPYFLPYPNKDGWYIIIYEEMTYWLLGGTYGNTLYYGTINTNAQNGKGELVTEKVFIHDNYHSGPTIAGYCNNSYYWLAIDRNENVVPDINTDRIYFYRIDESGLNEEPVINGELGIGSSGGYKFSPNGDKLFFLVGGDIFSDGNYVTDFNFKTGELYNFGRLTSMYNSRNEFSPNSRFFYFFDNSVLCQMDARYTSAANFINSTDTVLTLPPPAGQSNNGWDLRLTSDGRIYFRYVDVKTGEHKLGRIRFPNRKGLACSPELDVLTFPTHNIRFPKFMPGFFREKLPQPLDEVFPDAGLNQQLCPGDVISLGAENQPEVFYTWFPENYITEYFSPQTELKAPPHFDEPETNTFTLRATDGNCWLNFDEVEISRYPKNRPLEISGSWSVCPFVEEVDYWTPNNHYDYEPVWLVEGGEIVSGQGTDSIKINWRDTNPDAFVAVYSENEFGCISDTTYFPVRINVELLTETPNGPDELCIADAKNVTYQVHNTNGSVYVWTAEGGEILNGQGTNKVTVNWLQEGVNSLVVEETSTTIDTVCYGESEPLQVEIINDSIDIALLNVSFNNDDNVELEYYSEKLVNHRHTLYILAENEDTGREMQVHVSAEYDGSTYYFPSSAELAPETIRLKVENLCGELFISNPQQTIVVSERNTAEIDRALLVWNSNKYWDNNRVEYEVWHASERDGTWERIAGGISANQFDYFNEGFSLEHYFRIKANNLDKGVSSWSNTLRVVFENTIEIPDVFTPNGDGFNDVWEIQNIRFHEPERVTVYNRYGQKFYESRGSYVPWDGTFKDEVTQGTYFYEIVFDAQNIEYGQVTILQ